MICPTCQAAVRDGARFCPRCGATLAAPTPAPASASHKPSSGTAKVCPRCYASNRLNARMCSQCGYAFQQTTPAVSRRALVGLIVGASGLMVGIGLLAAVAGGVLSSRGLQATVPTPVRVVGTSPATPTSAPVSTAPPTLTLTPRPLTPTVAPPSPSPDWQAAMRRALRATVEIRVPMDARPGRASSGSASVITRKGHLLTNYHVLVDDNGQPYNANGVIQVATSLTEREPPVVTYLARLVAGDAGNDLALLRIDRRANGNALPGDLGLAVLPIGDSDQIGIGDELTILGYPGLGGETITLTAGRVSGFLRDENWIKTDAEINPGNSGGPAVNRAGEQVGVVSAAFSTRDQSRTPGKLGLIRPIKTARPLIDRARQEAGE